MRKEPEKEIRDILDAQEPASRNFKQFFQFGSRSLTHSHHLEVEFTNKKTEGVQILNHFASTSQEKITKLTEIHFQNRIIKIFDSLSYDNNHQGNNITNNQAQELITQQNHFRKNIMKKKYRRTLQPEDGALKLRDTKNVVKNIIRLYQGWVQTHQADCKQVQQSLGKLLASDKFNNRLILNISKDQDLRKSFLAFIEHSGEDTVSKSKINDKQSHIEALRQYRRICCDQQYKSQQSQKAKSNHQQSELSIKPHH